MKNFQQVQGQFRRIAELDSHRLPGRTRAMDDHQSNQGIECPSDGSGNKESRRLASPPEAEKPRAGLPASVGLRNPASSGLDENQISVTKSGGNEHTLLPIC